MLRILKLAVVHSSKMAPVGPVNVNVAVPHGTCYRRCCRRSTSFDEMWQVYKSWEQRDRLIQPAIARSCRLLREEGLFIFYTQNVFVVNNTHIHVLARWLGCLTDRQKSQVLLYVCLEDSPSADIESRLLSLLIFIMEGHMEIERPGILA